MNLVALGQTCELSEEMPDTMKISSTKLSSLLLLAISAAVVGCAQMPSRSNEDVITQRSNAFWDARMKNNVAEAYKFTPPSYRQIKDVESFRVDYAGIPMVDRREVVSVACEEAQDRCVLKQKFEVTPPMLRGTKVPVYADEVWIREDGQWWIYKK